MAVAGVGSGKSAKWGGPACGHSPHGYQPASPAPPRFDQWVQPYGSQSCKGLRGEAANLLTSPCTYDFLDTHQHSPCKILQTNMNASALITEFSHLPFSVNWLGSTRQVTRWPSVTLKQDNICLVIAQGILQQLRQNIKKESQTALLLSPLLSLILLRITES